MKTLDLNDVTAFVQVVESGSFSAAARRTNSPKSTVSRRVARLERALSVRLIQRTTRSLALTPAGKNYHARAASALAILRAASDASEAQQESPRGVVRMTAPADVGAEVLPRLVSAFAALYPAIRVEVELSPRTPDLLSGGFDVGLRAGRLEDSSFVARKIQDMPFRLYASPSYLAAHGAPKSAAGLTRHRCVLFRPTNGVCRWRLRGGRREVNVKVTGSISADDMSFVRRATVAGAGVALLPEVVGLGLVEAGDLAPVLIDLWMPGPPLYLVSPTSEHMPLRVRVFRDFLLQHFPQAGRKPERRDARPREATSSRPER